jgi:hypothetical protein
MLTFSLACYTTRVPSLLTRVRSYRETRLRLVTLLLVIVTCSIE